MSELAVLEINKGLILPRKKVEDCPIWGLGGVCDEYNRFVNESYYDGGWAKQGGWYNWEKEDFEDEEVVYIGLFLPHWGHFLIDLTCRMWCLPQICQGNPNIKVAYIGEENPERNHLRFLELLGVRSEQLVQIIKPTRFRKVYVPQQSFKSCEWYTGEFLKMLDLIVDNSLNGSTDFSSWRDIKKIYFTRKKFLKAACSEFGESFFENFFVHNGFVAIAPETLSLDEQIYLWNKASEIVCVNGTIPLNVLFSRNENLKLTVLNKTSIPHENPMILIKMRQLEVDFVDAYKEPLKDYPRSLGEGPYLFAKTSEFDEFIERKKYKLNWNNKKICSYFVYQELNYYWYILGIGRKLRDILSHLIPKEIKSHIRKHS